MFKKINRDCMREIFQPSRIVLAVVYDKINKRYNFLPVAFNMYSGYKPLSFCFAIHNINYSYALFEQEDSYCISIPGEKIAQEVLNSGLVSGEKCDKFSLFNFTPYFINGSKACGINECIINFFCEKLYFIPVGDHALVIGNVQSIHRNFNNNERNLLSISQNIIGYELLAQEGIHRIGVKCMNEG